MPKETESDIKSLLDSYLFSSDQNVLKLLTKRLINQELIILK